MKKWLNSLNFEVKGGFVGIFVYLLLILAVFAFVPLYLLINPDPSKMFPLAVVLLFAMVNFPWYSLIFASQGKLTILLADNFGLSEGWLQFLGSLFSVTVYFIIGYLLSLVIKKFRSHRESKKEE